MITWRSYFSTRTVVPLVSSKAGHLAVPKACEEYLFSISSKIWLADTPKYALFACSEKYEASTGCDSWNLVSRVYAPYCAGIRKRATLEKSVLISFKNYKNGRKLNTKEFVEPWFWKLGMRSSTGSPIFSDFKSRLSRVATSPTAGQEERRRWLRDCDCCSWSKG